MQVMLWDIRCARGALAVLRGHSGAVTSLSFLPDGLVLLSLGVDAHLRLWDVAHCLEMPSHFDLLPNE